MVETERRERRSLGLIAQVSDLLMDVDDPHALREIAAILRRAVVGWAAFYLNDGGLRVADGIDAGRPPTGQGLAARGGADGAGRGPDAVQQLLDAEIDRPVELRARTAPTGSGARRRGSPSRPRAELRPWPTTAESRCGPRLPAARSPPGARGARRARARRPRAARPGAVRAHRPGPDRPPRRAGHRQRAPLRRASTGWPRRCSARCCPSRPRSTGLDVWTYYAPNSENAQVGGDWYDVLQVSHGRGRRGHRRRRRARRRGGRVDGSAALGGPLVHVRHHDARARCWSGSTSSSPACACRARRAWSCPP